MQCEAEDVLVPAHVLGRERRLARINPGEIRQAGRHQAITRCSASSDHATSAAHSSREVFQAVTLARIVNTSPAPLAAPRPGMQVMVMSCPGQMSVNVGASWSVQVMVTLCCRN